MPVQPSMSYALVDYAHNPYRRAIGLTPAYQEYLGAFVHQPPRGLTPDQSTFGIVPDMMNNFIRGYSVN